jgi:DNA-binding Lrp family transcriptional regulator
MRVAAYILIQTELGEAAAVAQVAKDVPGVETAEDVTGPYDVIVRAQADDVNQLGKLVVSRIQAIPGITRTLTCPIVDL